MIQALLEGVIGPSVFLYCAYRAFNCYVDMKEGRR